MNTSNKVKKLFIIIIAAVIATTIIAVMRTNPFTPTKHIKIKSIPTSVSVKVNNNDTPLKDGGLKLKKGNYVLLFSADKYNNHIRNVVVDDDLSETTISVALEPLSPDVYKDSAENQIIIEESDKQTGGLLSFKQKTIKSAYTTATIAKCRSLRYADTTAACITSTKPIIDNSLKSQLQNDFNRSLALYEIYYGYNSMATVYKKENIRISYAYTLGETKPMLYIKTSLRDINEIYSQIELAGISREDVYINFENSELIKYNSVRQGGPEPQS